MPPAALSGTDQQYFGVQFGPSEFLSEKPLKGGKLELRYLRCYSEDLVQIVRYEWNIFNPRFGLPVMYRITLNDPRDMSSGGVGLPMATVFVHWSRVIHVADNRNSSEIFGVPRMRPVLNNILGLHKLYAADPEMGYRGAFPGHSFETHPQLGGDVLINVPALLDMYEQYGNSLQRAMVTSGMSVKSLAPQVSDLKSKFDVQIQAICIQLTMPQRVFMGTERGELASGQDDEKWNDRVGARQRDYDTPRVICPFIDRCIQLGILPEPEDGYTIDWPSMDSQSATDKAQIALTKTQAIVAYGQGGEAVYPRQQWLTKVMGETDDDAEEIVDEGEKQEKEQQQQAQDLADQHGMEPTGVDPKTGDIQGFQKPPPKPPAAPGMPGGPPQAPVKLGAGQSLVHPQTGKTVAKGPPQPKPGK
jgi:hypothetical protein